MTDSAPCDCLRASVGHSPLCSALAASNRTEQDDCHQLGAMGDFTGPNLIAELEAERDRLAAALYRIVNRCRLDTPDPAGGAAFAYHEAKRALGGDRV